MHTLTRARTSVCERDRSRVHADRHLLRLPSWQPYAILLYTRGSPYTRSYTLAMPVRRARKPVYRVYGIRMIDAAAADHHQNNNHNNK